MFKLNLPVLLKLRLNLINVLNFVFVQNIPKYLINIFPCRESVQNWGAMKNGEWSDNWCLDGLTCMYTHHYPWMIDNISHPLCKAHFLLFNTDKKICFKEMWSTSITILSAHQQLTTLCIFFIEILWRYIVQWRKVIIIEFKLKDDVIECDAISQPWI